MKKLLALLLVMTVSVTTLVGCTSGGGSGDSGTAELALITDVGTIDDKSFNQGTWEGVEKYAKEFNKTSKYYKPSAKTTDAYLNSIDLAVKNGAKIIMCPGYLFETAVFKAQTKYPEVKFVILDGAPRETEKSEDSIANNTASIFYAEQQSGFLAGYAAVKEGYKKLGFMGGIAVPAVIRFGYGFVQGADYAAKELGLPKDALEVKYTYVGNFDATPETQTMASTWYSQGTEVIFACGGAVGNSVMAAAEAAKTKVIGVDVDQSSESASVMTSALKELGNSSYKAIKDFYGNTFQGGKKEILDITKDGVGLAMKTAKFEKFKEADYKAIYDKLVKNENNVRTNIKDDAGVDSAEKLSTETTKVSLIK